MMPLGFIFIMKSNLLEHALDLRSPIEVVQGSLVPRPYGIGAGVRVCERD